VVGGMLTADSGSRWQMKLTNLERACKKQNALVCLGRQWGEKARIEASMLLPQVIKEAMSRQLRNG
jgi:hypothetical protein